MKNQLLSFLFRPLPLMMAAAVSLPLSLPHSAASAEPLAAAGETKPAAALPETAVPPLEARFREGLFAEEAGQDLKKASAAYQEIIAAFDRDRATAASALYRLGEVNRKEGRHAAAIECFARVAREFADREPLARMARENIRLLGGTPPDAGMAASAASDKSTPGQGQPAAVSADPEQDKALARLEEMLKTSPDLLLNAITSLKSNGCISYDEAIQAGYLRAVRFFLEHGASADLTPGGSGPLALAASYGNSQIIDLLLEKGADINGKKDTAIPLAAAAKNGHLSVVKQLLDAGAKVDGGGSPDVRSIEDVPLVEASRQGHKAVMELLLERGANPDGGRGESLIEVIINNRPDLVSLLLEKGASPGKGQRTLQRMLQDPNTAQRDPVIPGVTRSDAPGWASEYYLPVEYKGYVKFEPNGSAADRFFPIHLACLGNQPEIVKMLIAKGADVNLPTAIRKSTPLELACALNLRPIAELLVAAGAKADVPAPDGLRLVDLALSHRSLYWYQLMKKAGAVLTGVSPCGMSPLEAISLRGAENDKERAAYLELAAQLLNDGTDPNGTARFRPILKAARSQNAELVRLLKAKGADFNPPGGVFPVTVLMAGNAGYLEPGKVRSFPVKAAETLQALIEGGSDLNARSQPKEQQDWLDSKWSGYTALDMLAVCLPELDSLNRFLAFKPAISAAPGRNTAFQQALSEYTVLRKFSQARAQGLRGYSNSGREGFSVPSSRADVWEGSVDAILKSAPATLRRLWEYEKVEQNPDFASRAWVQVYHPDNEEAVCEMKPAGMHSASGRVPLAEALAEYGKTNCVVPDFTKLDVLARSGEKGDGPLVLRRTYDLAGLVANPASGPDAMPMLEPGEVLDLHPADPKKVNSWRNFPEPAASWIRTANTRLITVKAGTWTRVFKVVPELENFRWDPATDVLAVKPTLRTVLRYLPKPQWFYRTESIRVVEPAEGGQGGNGNTSNHNNGSGSGAGSGKPAAIPASPPTNAPGEKWFALNRPETADKDPALTSGTEITLEEIPAEDPELLKRKAQGVFVSSPKDGFLREVFRNANPPAGVPESTIKISEVLQKYYGESESVIAFPDLKSTTFRQIRQDFGPLREPWGGELAISRTSDPSPDPAMVFSMMDQLPETRRLTLTVRETVGIGRQIVLGFSGSMFTNSLDGWMVNHGNVDGDSTNPAGLRGDISITSPTLEAVSARLFGDRNPDKTRWLKLQSMEKPLAFRPGDSPLPFIVLQDGDSFILDPSDKAALLEDARPPARVRIPAGSPSGLPGRVVLPSGQ